MLNYSTSKNRIRISGHVPSNFLFKYNCSYIYIFFRLTVLTFSTLLDSYFYGRLQFSWWNFLQFNVFHNVSANYSVQSLYWYFVLGLPVVLGPCIVPFYSAIAAQMKDNLSLSDEIFYKLYKTVMFSLVLYR